MGIIARTYLMTHYLSDKELKKGIYDSGSESWILSWNLKIILKYFVSFHHYHTSQIMTIIWTHSYENYSNLYDNDVQRVHIKYLTPPLQVFALDPWPANFLSFNLPTFQLQAADFSPM